jgi:uncharacterized membrane protein YhaH (DUF805 family)
LNNRSLASAISNRGQSVQNPSPIGWALRPLKRYAEFSGRASRAEFWWFFLFVMVLYFVGALAMGFGVGRLEAQFGRDAPFAGGLGIVFAFVGLFWLGLFIPMLAVQVRRLHDTGRSGWWLGAFWLLYPVYLVLVLGTSLSSGQTGPSRGVGLAIASAIFALAFSVYSIVLLIFFCLPGTRGANRFGDDPYGANVAEVFA